MRSNNFSSQSYGVMPMPEAFRTTAFFPSFQLQSSPTHLQANEQPRDGLSDICGRVSQIFFTDNADDPSVTTGRISSVPSEQSLAYSSYIPLWLPPRKTRVPALLLQPLSQRIDTMRTSLHCLKLDSKAMKRSMAHQKTFWKLRYDQALRLRRHPPSFYARSETS